MLRGASKPVSSLSTTMMISGSSPFLKALMTLTVVGPLAAVLVHHLLPEDGDGVGVRLEDVVVALAVVGAGDQDLGGDQAEFVEVLLVEQGRRLVGRDELGLEGRALPVVADSGR